MIHRHVTDLWGALRSGLTLRRVALDCGATTADGGEGPPIAWRPGIALPIYLEKRRRRHFQYGFKSVYVIDHVLERRDHLPDDPAFRRGSNPGDVARLHVGVPTRVRHSSQ